MTSRRGLLRGAILAAVTASLVPAAVAVAHSGPAHGFGSGNGFGRQHQRVFHASGWVVPSANATTLTVRGFNGRSQSFTVNTSTKYTYADGSSATAANATPYHVVNVTGTAPTTTGGSPVATRVVIALATVEGIVKSDTAGTLTVVDNEGFARQVSTSSATCAQRRTTVSCAGIAAGSIVAARGTIASDGTTLDATRVSVAPASS
jgi:hypothetical protein